MVLDCEGRGTFTNRAVHFLIVGPSDYRLASAHDLVTEQEPMESGSLGRAVLQVLERGSATADDIYGGTGHSFGAVKNARMV